MSGDGVNAVHATVALALEASGVTIGVEGCPGAVLVPGVEPLPLIGVVGTFKGDEIVNPVVGVATAQLNETVCESVSAGSTHESWAMLETAVNEMGNVALSGAKELCSFTTIE